jgi:hypothetical protein
MSIASMLVKTSIQTGERRHWHTSLQFGIQNPIDHEQGSLDATDFPQGRPEFVLPRI